MTRRGASKRHGRRTGHLPACLRRARGRPGIGQAQQEWRHARGLGREREAAAAGQIEQRRIAAELQNDRAERPAAQRVHARTQQRLRVGQYAEDQPRRIEPEIGKARAIEAGPALRLFLAQPENRGRCIVPAGKAQGQHGREARGTGVALCILRENLVQLAPRQSAAQHAINPRKSERTHVPLRFGT